MSTPRPGAARTARLEQRRLQAAELFSAGARTTDVARTLGVAWRTAHKWRKALVTSGISGLRSRGAPGRSPVLDSLQRRRLRRILQAGAQRSGFPDDRWSLTRIRTVIEQIFAVRCSRVSIWRMLRRSPATAGLLSRSRPGGVGAPGGASADVPARQAPDPYPLSDDTSPVDPNPREGVCPG